MTRCRIQSVVQHKMKYRIILTLIILLFKLSAVCQDSEHRSLRLPIWTFHEKNVNIYGVSLGAFSWYGNDRNTVANGLRIEVPGVGFLTLLGNGSPVSHVDTITEGIRRQDFDFSEIINGVNISTGSWGELNYNGLTIGIAAQNGYVSHGIAIAGLWNSINKVNGISIGGLLLNESLQHNGIQIGGLGSSAILMNGIQIAVVNKAKTMKGLQIGVVNRTFKSTGIQIGLWNVNEHRKFPIINWSYGKKY